MKGLNKKTLRFKIGFIPIISVLIAILLITASIIFIAKESIMKQVKTDGIMIANQAVSQLEINDTALEIMNSNVEATAKNIANFINDNEKSISNDFLKKIAQQFEIDEINIGNKEGEIINSNLETSIGSVYDADHKASIVLRGEADVYMENIRKSRETDDYYKYGYVKRNSGGVIQIGILANKIQSFSDSVGYQALINSIKKEENIVYASYVDKNFNIVAHSIAEEVGTVREDEAVKNVLEKGETYTAKYFFDREQVNVYSIIVPVKEGNDIIGVIDIGLSLENVEDTIQNIIIIASIIAIVLFIIIFTLLALISRSVIKPIKELSISSKNIANGELYHSITVGSQDEIGVLASSFRDMVNNLKDIIVNIQSKTNETGEMSEQLSSSSSQLSSASTDVSYAIQEVAQGITSQANDILEITNYMSRLAEEIEGIHNKMDVVKLNVDDAGTKANEEVENIDNILTSFTNLRNGFNEVVKKVSILSTSISQIGSITEAINGISEQTNLLALNAAIEAARAGEAGKGFAVVAEEVRKLAQESRDATEQINLLINSITNETDEVNKTSKDVEELIINQVRAVEQTTNSLKDIINAFSNITPLIDDTYEYIDSTLNSKEIVMDKIQGVSSVSQEVSATTEEIAASSEEMMASAQEVSAYASRLRDISKELVDGVSKFKSDK
ncbi:methyl-accepting chemotaxis protein [Clostridium isatidis]|uniref:Chemotaxis protein n=1 Tax=Clostridium isatidis TaxID=182773 RepID=A0A343JEF6_9CLOT|nr:methyl-accepting chemotaxis protein [Clostridium isatidis]ASW43914.1 hypothetical protein BEN51_10590 [Clostridium isatidis]